MIRRKVKEYRAYYMGGKCYRYIGPDKKVHTYGTGKNKIVCRKWQSNYILREHIICILFIKK